MKCSVAAIAALLMPVALQASAEDWPSSSVTVAVEMPLAGFEEYLARELPNPLHSGGPSREICVEAERVCTRIPEFRGIKIYSRMECIDISPRISCDISESVTREGPLTLTGEGGTLTVVQAARASVTASGRGDIGKNIRQTVRAAAEFTLTATPSIDADWTPRPNVDLDYIWIEPPEFRLFNIIPVTIRGKVEPKLRTEIDRLERERLPELVSDLGLRDRMAALWGEVQTPRAISPGAGLPYLYVHFRPEAVAISALDFSGGLARATIRLDGRTAVTDVATSPWGAPTALPDLGELPSDASGFVLEVPVRVGHATLTAALGSASPRTFRIQKPVAGDVTVQGGRFLSAGDRLRVALDIAVTPDSALVPNYEGQVSFYIRPVYAPATRELRLTDLAFAPGTPAIVRRLLTLAVALGAIDDVVILPLAGELDAMQAALDDALFAADTSEIVRSGRIDVDVARIAADADGLSLLFRASGNLVLRIGLDR